MTGNCCVAALRKSIDDHNERHEDVDPCLGEAIRKNVTSRELGFLGVLLHPMRTLYIN